MREAKTGEGCDVEEMVVWNVREVPLGKEIFPGWNLVWGRGIADVDEIKSRVLKGETASWKILEIWREHVARSRLTNLWIFFF